MNRFGHIRRSEGNATIQFGKCILHLRTLWSDERISQRIGIDVNGYKFDRVVVSQIFQEILECFQRGCTVLTTLAGRGVKQYHHIGRQRNNIFWLWLDAQNEKGRIVLLVRIQSCCSTTDQQGFETLRGANTDNKTKSCKKNNRSIDHDKAPIPILMC